MSLAACRRSRFCAYETCSVFRCPFVLYRVHYPLYIEGSLGLPSYTATCLPRRGHYRGFRCRHLMHGLTDVGFIIRELGFNNWPVSPLPLWGLHAHRTCGAASYMPSGVPRVTSMLLSTIDFRRRVSSCPRGLTPSLSCVTQGFHMHRHGARSPPI